MRVRKSPLEACPGTAFGLVILGALVGCEPSHTHDITIVDGANTTRFTTKSAFAEYVELPGLRNELRITLASYPASCEHWEAPKDGETALSVTIVTPADQRPASASVMRFSWP